MEHYQTEAEAIQQEITLRVIDRAEKQDVLQAHIDQLKALKSTCQRVKKENAHKEKEHEIALNNALGMIEQLAKYSDDFTEQIKNSITSIV